MVALMRGDVNRAMETFEESLTVARQIGDKTGACITLYNLAQVSLFRATTSMLQPFSRRDHALRAVTDRANVAYCLEGWPRLRGCR
jgi:hypothetical protein